MKEQLAMHATVAGPSTVALRRQGVIRAIQAMRERMAGPLSLRELAKTAAMSQFHFDRVFRELTGIPPFQFLSAMRLAAARDMLITTDSPIAEVCFEVGYSSLGTFTRRFTALVGTSPHKLRRASRNMSALPHDIATPAAANPAEEGGSLGVQVRGATQDMLVFIGVFATALPVGRPLACALASSSGSAVLRRVPPGPHYVRAAAFPPTAMLDRDIRASTLVGTAFVNGGAEGAGQISIELRPLDITDPPIVSFLPLLLREQALGVARRSPAA